MNERANPRVRVRHKLNRQQIIDILERNVALYKDDPSFVQYLVELAIYLMEFEYDWSQPGVDMPERIRLNIIEGDPNKTPPPRIIPTPDKTAQTEEAVDPKPSPLPRPIISNVFASPSLKNQKHCPFCGTPVGEALICPSCRNLTK